MSKKGFTLIELAIVLVIIGLLVVSVLQGQELVKQARIRKDLASIQDFRRAIETFRSKYDQLPGDFDRADTLWPDCVSTSVNATDFNCNGDGDGTWGITEGMRVFEHLARAELIKGNYRLIIGGTMIENAVNNRDNYSPMLESTGQHVLVSGRIWYPAFFNATDTSYFQFLFDSNIFFSAADAAS